MFFLSILAIHIGRKVVRKGGPFLRVPFYVVVQGNHEEHHHILSFSCCFFWGGWSPENDAQKASIVPCFLRIGRGGSVRFVTARRCRSPTASMTCAEGVCVFLGSGRGWGKGLSKATPRHFWGLPLVPYLVCPAFDRLRLFTSRSVWPQKHIPPPKQKEEHVPPSLKKK